MALLLQARLLEEEGSDGLLAYNLTTVASLSHQPYGGEEVQEPYRYRS
jgi:hypothetical protein